MKKYIQNFKVYFSESEIAQESATEWLSYYHGLENKQLFDNYAVRPDFIASRQVYAKGVGSIPYHGEALYALDETSTPTLSQRSLHAQQKIEEIFSTLYAEETQIPSHLNHVSCTHYQSPSAAQKIVIQKEWFEQTIVTHLYHMGCYASLPALRVSKATVADGADLVDIVHTELCSFHLDKMNLTPEQTIMKTLFSDGAIKYSVTSENYFNQSNRDGLEIVALKEMILPGSDKEMTWKIGDLNFEMTLSKSVPVLVARNIEKFMRALFLKAEIDYDANKDNILFAVHPGGPKIIELVEKILKLDPRQVAHSKSILRTRGNMSSATLPHIWDEILRDEQVLDSTYIATVAFGPGLTMTGGLLKTCKR